MYRLIIVEDDENIRIGLGEYFDWASMGLALAGDAGDGEEGLALTLEMEADIVLTDVKMPRMDGIEMAKRLREAGWDGALVFLSAYGDVEKVRAALRMHADDYVLKPFEDEQIVEAMRRAIAKLNQRFSLLRLQRAQRWHGLIQGNDSSAQEKCAYVVALIRAEEGLDRVIDRVRSEEYGLLWVDRVGEQEAVGIWTGSPDESQSAASAAMLEEAVFSASPSASVSVSPWIDECWRIPMTLTKLRQAVEEKDVYPGSGNAEAIPAEELARRIAENLLYPPPDGTLIHCDAVFDAINTAEVRSLRGLQDKCLVLLQRVTDQLAANTFVEQCEKWRKKTSGMVLECTQTNALRHVILSGLKALGVLVEEHRGAMNLYASIHQSVLRNLKNANIQSIVAETGYSKWVITKAIRSECGSTVNEWIQKMRIEEAKRLLIKTGLKIYEISAQVGYASVDYFSALFREKTGVTPEQYRQNHV